MWKGLIFLLILFLLFNFSPFFRDSHYGILVCVQCLQHYQSFFFLFPGFVSSIDLYSCLLIFSACSDLLLSALNEFLFQLYFSAPEFLFHSFFFFYNFYLFNDILYLVRHCSFSALGMLSCSPLKTFRIVDSKDLATNVIV